MIDPHDKSDWRSVMLAQYSMFGTIAGLEVASLAIFATLLNTPIHLLTKILFTLTTITLLIEVPFLLWLINKERKVAFNDPNMKWFQTNERYFRKTLIWIIGLGWLLILALLLSAIWMQETS